MTAATKSAPMLSPPDVARRLGVDPAKIIAWIRKGELLAVDVSNNPGSGKPRFRIDPLDLQVFLDKRSVAATPKPARRRRANPSVVEYF